MLKSAIYLRVEAKGNSNEARKLNSYSNEGNAELIEIQNLIRRDSIALIIEVKGNKIAEKTKSGHKQKIKDQLEDLIVHPYKQGQRASRYLRSNLNPEFKTKNGKRYNINMESINKVVLVSLTLESIGTLSVQMKNDNSVFESDDFPLTTNIFDLQVYADLFDNPFLFIHFIKERKRFLKIKNADVFEELDLLGYYLNNPLYVEALINSIPTDIDFNFIQVDNMTDEINNYYMHKFNNNYHRVLRPQVNLNSILLRFLQSLEEQTCDKRLNFALFLLSLPSHAHDFIFSKL